MMFFHSILKMDAAARSCEVLVSYSNSTRSLTYLLHDAGHSLKS